MCKKLFLHRVQLQIVNQLEFQLSKEKDRLSSMMKHLRLELNKNGDLRPCTTSTPTTTEMRIKTSASPISAMSHLDLLQSSIERGELVRKENILKTNTVNPRYRICRDHSVGPEVVYTPFSYIFW